MGYRMQRWPGRDRFPDTFGSRDSGEDDGRTRVVHPRIWRPANGYLGVMAEDKHLDFNSPDSDPPMAESSVISDASEDPFADFDVESGSEKDFMMDLLENNAPDEEVNKFQRARRALTPEFSDSTSSSNSTLVHQQLGESIIHDRDGYDTPVSADIECGAIHCPPQDLIDNFFQRHKILADKSTEPGIAQWQELEYDVYDFARALGMAPASACLEAKRARMACLRKRALGKLAALNEPDDHCYIQRDGLSTAVRACSEVTALQATCNKGSCQKHKENCADSDARATETDNGICFHENQKRGKKQNTLSQLTSTNSIHSVTDVKQKQPPTNKKRSKRRKKDKHADSVHESHHRRAEDHNMASTKTFGLGRITSLRAKALRLMLATTSKESGSIKVDQQPTPVSSNTTGLDAGERKHRKRSKRKMKRNTKSVVADNSPAAFESVRTSEVQYLRNPITDSATYLLGEDSPSNRVLFQENDMEISNDKEGAHTIRNNIVDQPKREREIRSESQEQANGSLDINQNAVSNAVHAQNTTQVDSVNEFKAFFEDDILRANSEQNESHHEFGTSDQMHHITRSGDSPSSVLGELMETSGLSLGTNRTTSHSSEEGCGGTPEEDGEVEPPEEVAAIAEQEARCGDSQGSTSGGSILGLRAGNDDTWYAQVDPGTPFVEHEHTSESLGNHPQVITLSPSKSSISSLVLGSASGTEAERLNGENLPSLVSPPDAAHADDLGSSGEKISSTRSSESRVEQNLPTNRPGCEIGDLISNRGTILSTSEGTLLSDSADAPLGLNCLGAKHLPSSRTSVAPGSETATSIDNEPSKTNLASSAKKPRRSRAKVVTASPYFIPLEGFAKPKRSATCVECSVSDTDATKANEVSTQHEVVAKERRPRAKRAKTDDKSPFFPSLIQDKESKRKRATSETRESPKKKVRPKAGTVSCVPFPRLDAERFGLIQEKFAKDPFRMLIAVTFLNRTKGKDAIPVFFQLMDRYDSPAKLAAAENDDIVEIVRHLGLQVARAKSLKKIASFFVDDPPIRGRRYRVLNYPEKGLGFGTDINKDEILTDEDARYGAWEIGHFVTGAYALDSYRIFCRDILRGEAEGWNGEGRGDDFEPEWKRVVPVDKELRALLMWAWLREGIRYDALSGEKEPASDELLDAGAEGRIAWDDNGMMRIVDPEEVEQGEVQLVAGGGNSEELLHQLEEEGAAAS
ncbi:MAG: hypothetical protein M1818_001190 [Claussenomyces sp. TS43310]|nr:MAG: hypothetical protein M1818_001190 [Claussenomyces sp. TS43310]